MATDDDNTRGRGRRKSADPLASAVARASGTRARPRTARDATPGRRRKGAPRGPQVRSASVKVPHGVARRLRAGHPWIYRDALTRPLAGVEAGAVVPVADEEGYPVGAAAFEPEGTVALRMVSVDPEFDWSLAHVQRRFD